MQISILFGQVPVTWDVDANLRTLRDVVDEARPGDVVVLPEGMLSGYGEDLTPLEALDPALIENAVAQVGTFAVQRQVQIFSGAGAELFVSMTNAANTRETDGVWRSHLISRAAENQRFVVSANIAHPEQHCPSMVVSPRGEVLGELAAGAAGLLKQTCDLTQVGDWYLGQRRQDVLSLAYHGPE